MKKWLVLLLALALVLAFAACGPAEDPVVDEPAEPAEPVAEEPAEEGPFVALVTDVGNIDDESFNQACWEAVMQFGDEFGFDYSYYRPSEDSTEARKVTMSTAIADGADVIVCPGFLFEEAVYNMQYDNPEVSFLLIDGEPHTADYSVYDTAANVHCILYQEEQSGFFAGYAAVMDGFTKLGYVGGMEVPAVQRFGYGFVQGADYAAQQLGVNVDVNYWYAGVFAPSDDIYNTSSSWYADGTEVIFACGGGLYQSVVQAAEEVEGYYVIGVDVDQSYISPTIITSAMKQLKYTTYVSLCDLKDNEWVWPADYAAATAKLGAADNATGIPTETDSWRFRSFTVDQYNEVLAGVIDGSIPVSEAIDAMPATTNVTVTVK